MKKAKKPTRRWRLRKVVHAHLREMAAAKVAMGKADLNSGEYETARWKEHHFYGRALGAIQAAMALGLITWPEQRRLEQRVKRVDDAAEVRWRKFHEEKYAHILKEKSS